MTNTNNKIRKASKVKTESTRPRLLVFRSNKSIYAQVINADGKVVASASSIKSKDQNKIQAAKAVGSEIAKLSIKSKISQVAFDRNGYKYHGRVAALAEAARAAGLKF